MEVTLSKNGWHRKLQKFVFSDPPHFYNFCPYFWLTIFCIIVTFIIPAIPIWKVIRFIFLSFAWVMDKILDLFEKIICEPMVRHFAETMDEENIIKSYHCHLWDLDNFWNDTFANYTEEQKKEYNFWSDDYSRILDMYSDKRKKLAKKFELWKQKNKNWESKIEEIKERQKKEYYDRKEREQKLWAEIAERQLKAEEERRKKEEQAYQNKINRQKMFNTIMKFTKWVSYILGSVIICFCLYWVYVFLNWTYNSINWNGVFTWMVSMSKPFGIGLLISISTVALCYISFNLGKKCTISFKDIHVPGWIVKFIEGTEKFFIKVWAAMCWIGAGFKFFFIFIKSVKENYCPGIKWVDSNSMQK